MAETAEILRFRANQLASLRTQAHAIGNDLALAASAVRGAADRSDEAEAYIAKLRPLLLNYFGTTDPELLAEVWGDWAFEAQRAASPENPNG